MNYSEQTQLHLAQEADKQALQEHFRVLDDEQLEEVTGAMDPGSPDVTKISYHDYLKTLPPPYNPLKRTAAEARLTDYNSGPNKLLKIATDIIRR